MLSSMGIRDVVQEVRTDKGKQFVSASFAAMLASVLPGVCHCTIPAYAFLLKGLKEWSNGTYRRHTDKCGL